MLQDGHGYRCQRCCELMKRNVSFHGTASCLKDFWSKCLRFDKFLAMPGVVGKCIV